MGREAESNEDLRAVYEAVYARGQEQFFSKFVDGENTSATNRVLVEAIDWRGLRVLDVGCGTGEVAAELVEAGAASVVGIDYSEKAIAIARERFGHLNEVQFEAVDMFSFEAERVFDVCLSLGTIEHTDQPSEFLSTLARHCKPGGHVVISCPHFLNLRGFVWMALSELLDVPMSLTDLHFIHPWDIAEWATAAGCELDYSTTTDRDQANGSRLLGDFAKRLPNALRDAGLPVDGVEGYLDYLRRVTSYLASEGGHSCLEGSTALYRLKRKVGAT